jgi:hypothetical protein
MRWQAGGEEDGEGDGGIADIEVCGRKWHPHKANSDLS